MAKPRNRARTAKWHRRLGLFLSIPLLAWIVSAFALHYFGLVMPNGLQGVYKLTPYNSVDVDLRTAQTSPTEILRKLRSDLQIDEVYWLKLQSRGRHLWYIAKSTPFNLGMVFDARTGERLDPLPDALLELVANESLQGSHAVSLSPAQQYHRDYSMKEVPAVKVIMAGDQSTELVLSQATGRTLRRSDGQARQFNWWYKKLHVFQWGKNMAAFTTVLYILAAFVVVLAFFGFRLWWWRRSRPKTAYAKAKMKTRLWHRRLGIVVGVLVFAQATLGAYMWLSLGPLQDPFRGKNTFNHAWSGGISTAAPLPDIETTLSQARPKDGPARPIQSIQWRVFNGRTVCVVAARNDDLGKVYDALTGQALEGLTPEAAGKAAQQLMAGSPSFDYRKETTYYYNDLNRKIAAYHFRFADDSATDVFISKTTGDIISRRTTFWRAFSPILMLHTYAFTDNVIVDTILLIVFQIGLLALIFTGWRLNFSTKSSKIAEGQSE